MNDQFKLSEWTVVLPRQSTGLLASPYLEPASIVARETGSDLGECFGCGQLREHVSEVLDGDARVAVCSDCRRERGV